ncbi:MAG TPA: lamin tail domain-containing protein, partial [Verrucomicrobiae bacterium]|nr:lamin tail domain-containing protein [Verrucomicrobiae bacterium]
MAGRLCALLCACSTLWFCATASVRAAPGPLLIGEIGWAGSSKSSADEWLELWNRSTEPVDLNGYSLEGAGGGKDIVFNADDVIAPQSAFLVANYAASDTKSALASDPQVVTTTLSLPNDVLDIKLFDADGTLVDEAGTGGTPPAGFSSSTKASMVRLQDGTWVTANTREHFDDGIADFGTPGSCDGCSWADTSPVDAAAAYPPAATSSESTTTEPLIPETSSPAPEIITITSTPAAVELPVEPVQDIQTNANTEPVIVMVTPPDIRLARVFPAPSSGKEWVELNLPDGADARDWMLYDASGKILTIAASSSHIELNSARLNNGGDTVELRRPDGSVAERMTYPATPRDAYWEKNADQSAWVMVDPNAETTAPQETPEPEIVTTYAPAPPTIELPIATSDTVAGTPSAPETADRTRAIAKPKTSKPKTTAVKKSVPADRAISFDMLTKIEPNVRVAITGVVATKPGIMNKNQFVLLSADGHG